MIKNMLEDLESQTKSKDDLSNQSSCLIQGVRSKTYQPLMKRVTCGSY